ncbi:hypothetical protein [Mesorhizobium sp. M1E.F.Ca.ET.063.01.1.1]|uniref:hypothetical protein n=1 Tax=Mesorhizobium sp. M1E.F.Ca.ET.063.01.1.1 TaxID=2496750 RepID=UPI00167529D2|nr:hypothetical protein [Mesorhizobium sp. M1E.F.Ca.ET.063.01.1.1]
MASAQQLIGLVKSHAEGDGERFFELAMQLAAAEGQKATPAWRNNSGSGPKPVSSPQNKCLRRQLRSQRVAATWLRSQRELPDHPAQRPDPA